MLLQAAQAETFISKAFEQGALVGFFGVAIFILGWVIKSQYKDLKTERESKFKIAAESLGLIKIVENQLSDNKSSNETVIQATNQIVTEIKLIKQSLENNKK